MAQSDALLVYHLKDAGRFPNHPTLPVLVYKQAAPELSSEGRARWFEEAWLRHQWRSAWRWGVYSFPHYHSTAHEVLGVFQGRANLRIGDQMGLTVGIEAGDMVILPAGTAHENLGSSSDFRVVGGYPDGQEADLLRGIPGERPAADQRIALVPLPASDPISGRDEAPVRLHWLKSRPGRLA